MPNLSCLQAKDQKKSKSGGVFNHTLAIEIYSYVAFASLPGPSPKRPRHDETKLTIVEEPSKAKKATHIRSVSSISSMNRVAELSENPSPRSKKPSSTRKPHSKTCVIFFVSYHKPYFIFVVGNLSRLKTMITSQLLIPLSVSEFVVTRQNALNTSRISLNVERWNLIMSSASDVACLSILAVNRLTRSVLGRSTEYDVIRNHRKP